jgi:ABC-type nitrate/sulfonate/bicarbonate transport system substrate-binding protein
MAVKNTHIIIGAAIVIIAIIAIAAGATFLLGQKGSSVSGSVGSALETNTIVANVNKDCSATPWVVGEVESFFNNSGINFIDAGALSWDLQPAALISGQTNVYDGHPNSIIQLLEANAQIQGVLQSGQEPAPSPENVSKEHMHWLVLNNSPLYNASDIITFVQQNGRPVKIGVGGLGLCTDLETNAWLRENNIPQSDIQYVVIPDPNQLQALDQGLIDVACLHPPFYSAAEHDSKPTDVGGGVRIYFTSTQAFGANAGTSLLTFTDAFIKSNPDTVRKFAEAYHSAEVWANSNPVPAASQTGNWIGLANDTNVHYYSWDGAVNDTELQAWINAMVADGDIKQGQYTPSDLYTTEFSDIWGNASDLETANATS